MTHLFDVITQDGLKEALDNDLVTIRQHNEHPLSILNYSKKCGYERAWNQTTNACRGLIYNSATLEVVARPFEKFFNWDEGKFYPPTGPVLRMDKMDGSLGILYPIYEERWNGGIPDQFCTGYAISTRGSFHSEQAEWATKFFNDAREYPDDQFYNFMPFTDKTYLFEIIYPENRIVVDYGDYKGLVLIDVIDNATSFSDTDEFDDCDFPDKVTRTPVAGFDSGQVVDIVEGNEGFVYLWPTRNIRTKMKAASYVHLHRLISNLNEKSIWEALLAGKTLGDLKLDLPEEFWGFIDDKGKVIMKKASDIMHNAYMDYDAVKGLPTRKDQAMALSLPGVENKGLIFKLLDNSPSIWLDCLRMVKPKRTPTED